MIHQFPGRRLGAYIILIKPCCFRLLTLRTKLNNTSSVSVHQILVLKELLHLIYEKGPLKGKSFLTFLLIPLGKEWKIF